MFACTFPAGTKNMKRTLLMMVGAAALTVALVLTGSRGAVAAPDAARLGFYPAPGTTCLVQIRSDALGQTGPSASLPLTANANSTLRGKLKAMDNEWVVLTTDRGEVFIPMRVVLLVQPNPK